MIVEKSTYATETQATYPLAPSRKFDEFYWDERSATLAPCHFYSSLRLHSFVRPLVFSLFHPPPPPSFLTPCWKKFLRPLSRRRAWFGEGEEDRIHYRLPVESREGGREEACYRVINCNVVIDDFWRFFMGDYYCRETARGTRWGRIIFWLTKNWSKFFIKVLSLHFELSYFYLK